MLVWDVVVRRVVVVVSGTMKGDREVLTGEAVIGVVVVEVAPDNSLSFRLASVQRIGNRLLHLPGVPSKTQILLCVASVQKIA